MRTNGGAGKVVLVVEDEAVIRMVLAEYLADCGYMVREAGTADEAVVILGGNGAVAAVVTDVRMPGSMDGIGLVEWMRRHRQGIPVVVTSGYVRIEEVRAANPNALVMGKPYSPEQVATLLAGMVVESP